MYVLHRTFGLISKKLSIYLYRLWLELRGELPPFTGLPRGLILGNLHSYTRIPIRYRGVGKRLVQRPSEKSSSRKLAQALSYSRLDMPHCYFGLFYSSWPLFAV